MLEGFTNQLESEIVLLHISDIIFQTLYFSGFLTNSKF